MIAPARRFRYCMARLALVAMLLVALAPTISRWVHATPASPPAMLALCTTDGLESRPSSLLPSAGQIPEPSHPMQDGYCGHCPLLASVAPLLLAALLLAPPSGELPLPEWRAPLWPAPTLLQGLWARGPPLPL